jgi:hypothetical protein
MTDLIITALAAWRLARMLVDEDGPAAVFARLRYRVGMRQTVVTNGENAEVTMIAQTPIAELFACVWCMSVWTAALLALAPLRPLRAVMAASGGAIIVQEVVNWLVYRQR